MVVAHAEAHYLQRDAEIAAPAADFAFAWLSSQALLDSGRRLMRSVHPEPFPATSYLHYFASARLPPAPSALPIQVDAEKRGDRGCSLRMDMWAALRFVAGKAWAHFHGPLNNAFPLSAVSSLTCAEPRSSSAQSSRPAFPSYGRNKQRQWSTRSRERAQAESSSASALHTNNPRSNQGEGVLSAVIPFRNFR